MILDVPEADIRKTPDPDMPSLTEADRDPVHPLGLIPDRELALMPTALIAACIALLAALGVDHAAPEHNKPIFQRLPRRGIPCFEHIVDVS